MREIKFKFVLKNDETGHIVITRTFTLEKCLSILPEQINESLESCDNNSSCMMNGYCECPSEYADYEIIDDMQSTGIKDKNGLEIYEKDIVKGFGKLFTVKFGIIEREIASDNGDINMVQIPSFYFECEGQALYPITENYKGESDLKTLEVIGNIYENPELLGDTND